MALSDTPAVYRGAGFALRLVDSARPTGTQLAKPQTAPVRKTYQPVINRVNVGARIFRKEALYAVSPEFPLGTTDTTGHYAAVVKQNNVPLANCRIGLYWRDNMQLIAKAVSNENGEFRFEGLIPNINRYFAIALDPDGGVFQNALVYDRIMPIK